MLNKHISRRKKSVPDTSIVSLVTSDRPQLHNEGDEVLIFYYLGGTSLRCDSTGFKFLRGFNFLFIKS